MWRKAFFALVFFLVFMGILFTAIVAHELTHLVGSAPPRGICLGFCGECLGKPAFSVLGFASAGSFNPVFFGEFYPVLVSFAVVFVLTLCFLGLLWKNRFILNKD